MLLTTVTTVTIVFLEALHPYLIRQFIDAFTSESAVEEVYRIFWMLVALLLTTITVHRIFDWSITYFEAGVIRDLIQRSFAAINRQSLRFFENNFTGSLVKQAGRFNSAFEGIADAMYFQLGRVALIILMTFVIFAREYPQMALLYAGWLVVFVATNVIMALWKYPFDKANAESDSRVGAQFADTVGNYAAVKSFAMERLEQNRFDDIAEDNYRKRKRAWIASNWLNVVQGFTMTAFELLLIWMMIRGWERGTVTIGDFVFFQSYVLWMFGSLWGLGNNIRRVYQHAADAKEMADIFETTPEVLDAAGARPLLVEEGAIKFHHVHFSYVDKESHERKEIEDLTLDISGGQSVALVGPSGAGKSTIVKILMRQFDLDSGYIRIDNQDIANATQESLRQHIALVPQEPALFHRSLRDNIAFARQDATEEEVIRAAKQAHAWEFIQQLPNKLDTLVGERGVKLSGGERQRIALARAFLADCPILILDEATSSLDSRTEKLIQDAIEDLLVDRTSIVIAHRLSTIMAMDRIIVLEQGEIAEQGTHSELLDQEKLYATLWSHQSGGYIE